MRKGVKAILLAFSRSDFAPLFLKVDKSGFL